ncbi:hypothetical protein Rsub_11505 [Raphidocelis subcapitata]|uniref:PIH1D1/2/3 CS-like domain-containing protein n=1 Tax=Raphidocelis subcapitata TaxID=307507 RepID=A0A2V0PFA2_9CHLO|nr:hypothetical protein Rsub_11505 [Raphidocelis subcapitata]|eukprot:GBF98514.1 hypothetical protein Rsub_11505 [Raphidocelis subcapitata]
MFAPGSSLSDFEALSKLLCPQETREEDPEPCSSGAQATPAAIGSSDLLPVTVAAPRGARVEAAAKSGAGVSAAANGGLSSAAAAAAERERLEEAEAFDRDDGREVPSAEFVYKQAVCTSDAFLGLSGKDPSSACCEELVVRIHLPAAKSAAELDLDVRPTRLRLSSDRYKLLLHLPRKVDADHGRARWDAARRELAVSAPIVADEDLLLGA